MSPASVPHRARNPLNDFAFPGGEVGLTSAFLEGEMCNYGSRRILSYREILAGKLAESIASPPSDGTRRRVFGRVGLPGKATTVIGM